MPCRSTPELNDLGQQVLKLHKHVLSVLAQYEHLSKRISSLPSPEGSSQATVQSAIARSAATFLAMQMVKLQVRYCVLIRSCLFRLGSEPPPLSRVKRPKLSLQSLPRYQKRLAEQKKQDLNLSIVETTLADQLKLEGVGNSKADNAAFALQPLLEQEAQLE